MTEPKTEAGRALHDDARRLLLEQFGNDEAIPEFASWLRERILAIETEAVKPWRKALDGVLSIALFTVPHYQDPNTYVSPEVAAARALLDESKP